MVFGRYKKTHIFLIRHDETGKWYADNNSAENHKNYSDFYDTIDELRDALRLNTTNWYDIHTHINQLLELKGFKKVA